MMSDLRMRGMTLGGRRALVLGVVLAVVLLLLGVGTLLGPEEPAVHANSTPRVGRTTTICTTSAPLNGESVGKTEVSAVAVREAPDRSGVLAGGTLLDSKPVALKVTAQGKGAQLSGATSPIVISSDGAMASASNAVIVNDIREGSEVGLKAAPCLAPATSHWFSGLGPTEDDRTDLILTNADDAQAQVDLRFYGQNGRVAVSGSSGVVIKAHDSTPISLGGRVPRDGPLSVSVQATQGRVTAVAKRTRTDQNKPAGVDWQIPSAAPSKIVVVPGIPGDGGGRQLMITNPNNARAAVAVQVLGLQGPYAPSGAASVDVPAESTASVNLEPGLAGEAGSIKLTSDVPVTGAVVSSSRRAGARTDLAVQSAAVPLTGSGVSAVATRDIVDSELIISNAGEDDAQVSFQVFSYDGVMLRTADMLLGPNTTATRRLNSPAPSYVVVKVPDRSSVVGGVVLTQPERRDVAGLATIPLGSPDLASRAPATRPDYAAGQ
jgi:hypothetical protein